MTNYYDFETLLSSNKKYSIIYADPPWSFNNKNTGGSMVSGAKSKYDVMSYKDICSLPIQDITTDNAILFMWWVASQPYEALEVVKNWGFLVKTMTGFNWVKLTKKGKLFFGMGFYTRQGSENCLIAIKGKPKILDHSIRAVIQAPNEKHSKKPDIFSDKIIDLCGDLSRIELFARESKDGWDSLGNQLENPLLIT